MDAPCLYDDVPVRGAEVTLKETNWKKCKNRLCFFGKSVICAEKKNPTHCCRIKSGKDYTTHRALNKFVSNSDYHISQALVLSNEQKVFAEDKITYIPIYYSMFL